MRFQYTVAEVYNALEGQDLVSLAWEDIQLFIRLASQLRHRIALVQSRECSDTPPIELPIGVTNLLAFALNWKDRTVANAWSALKDLIWDAAPLDIGADYYSATRDADNALFTKYGQTCMLGQWLPLVCITVDKY